MIARHFKTFQAGEMVSTEGLRIGSVEVWPFGAGKMRLLQLTAWSASVALNILKGRV